MSAYGRARFTGRTVVVTGAGSGIGRETAVSFATEGAEVVVADIDEAAAAATVEQITATGGRAAAVRTDVSDPASVEALMDRTVELFGKLDVLHNNAFWAPLYRPVVDTTVDEWDRTIGVTLTGVFLGCKFGIPRMVAGGGGVIVNTASVAALTVNPKYAAYMAAKGGVVALTKSIAYDYGPQHIRCNAVAPGLVQGTGATRPVFENPERVEWLMRKIALGRPGQPSDIAKAVLFLTSDDADYITGDTMVVDGGRLIG
ncbi:SDR family NAD(P)-dependent oxidoreductase [Nakamurella leprariae]|uniref:SDR family oxidoreductase n=1 Tax=Nakamurella leprariae TaxID=2803911 RepID=A0A939C0G9_9ACTN|nr:SDR family oxidoreductase [Nakamurella leprariae]MBM9468746.1 SDR family oxidoreductase [Nakamurella leprariae]